MKYVELILLLLMLGISLNCALGIEEPAFSLQKDYMGVSGYPRLVGSFLALLCVLRMLWLLSSRAKEYLQKNVSHNAPPITKIFVPVGLAVVFVYGISTIGFILCTFLYLLLMPFLLDKDATYQFLGKHALYAGIVTGILYTFFRIFKIYLPSTILF